MRSEVLAGFDLPRRTSSGPDEIRYEVDPDWTMDFVGRVGEECLHEHGGRTVFVSSAVDVARQERVRADVRQAVSAEREAVECEGTEVGHVVRGEGRQKGSIRHLRSSLPCDTRPRESSASVCAAHAPDAAGAVCAARAVAVLCALFLLSQCSFRGDGSFVGHSWLRFDSFFLLGVFLYFVQRNRRNGTMECWVIVRVGGGCASR